MRTRPYETHQGACEVWRVPHGHESGMRGGHASTGWPQGASPATDSKVGSSRFVVNGQLPDCGLFGVLVGWEGSCATPVGRGYGRIGVEVPRIGSDPATDHQEDLDGGPPYVVVLPRARHLLLSL